MDDNMIKNQRLIYTGLTTTDEMSVLQSVMGQLSDGMWENTPSKVSYWYCANITQDDKGRIYLVINPHMFYTNRATGHYNTNKYYDMSDIEILEFWKKHIKLIFNCEVRHYPNRQLKWSENCNEVLAYFHDGLSVASVYNCYNKFENHIKKVNAISVFMGGNV